LPRALLPLEGDLGGDISICIIGAAESKAENGQATTLKVTGHYPIFFPVPLGVTQHDGLRSMSWAAPI